MIATDRLLPFVLTAFAIIVVPGPSVLFVIGRGVSLGRRAALATVVGNSIGIYVQVVAVAVGIGALVERSAAVFAAVKLAGAAYLIALGVRALLDRRRHAGVVDAPVAPPGAARLVRDGFVVGAANPKAIVFLSAMLPQFVDPTLGHVPLQILLLGLVFVTVGLASDGAWGMAAGTARTWLARSPRRLEALRSTSAAVMVGLGVRLALTGRED